MLWSHDFYRCAAKKLHDILVQAENQNEFIIGRFKEECLKHSQLRHPNIVQLMGVHTRPDSKIPMLIMEYLPFTLSKCLEKHKNIPLTVKHDILLDVSIGLRFLHEQTPPIIHRDLTANNVMLTYDMRAKIADFGQAKITNVQMTPLTVAPGTSCYMPPEALVKSPTYDVTMDVFSFGVLTIHTVIQECPLPSEPFVVDRNIQGSLSPVSEVDRRQAYLELMGDSSPLTSLARECLNNDSRLRPKLIEIIDRLRALVSQSPTAIRSLLESMEIIEESKARLSSLESTLEDVEVQVEALLQDVQSNLSTSEIERNLSSLSNLVHASCHQREALGESRLAVIYRSSENKGQELPIQLSRSDKNLMSLVLPPINIRFTGTYSKTILSGLSSPKGITVSSEGLVYICDEQGRKAVHIYNPKNAKVKTMVESTATLEISPPDEKCWHPSGIALDLSGNILLSDTDSHRVLKFSPEGALLATAGNNYSSGEREGEFNMPKGIAVAKRGDVFVCDRDNHRVQVLNSQLRFKTKFGSYGNGTTEFNHPIDVAFDSAGNIYVVDSSNYCVKVFTPSFNPLQQIGSGGNQYYNFRAPMNICIDSNDLVYVTDWSKHCVMVFDKTGVFKMYFGDYGKYKDGHFDHPMGIAVDALGQVYVCDNRNGCVQMFV